MSSKAKLRSGSGHIDYTPLAAADGMKQTSS